MSLFSWTNFTSGELTPLLQSRVDLDIYYRSAKEITNFIPLAYGPIKRRPGFEFIGKCLDIFDTDGNIKKTEIRLIPYKYSVKDSYVLEFGEKYFRVITSKGYLKNADIDEILTVPTQYISGDIKLLSYAQHKDRLYLCHKNYPPAIIYPKAGSWVIENMRFNSESEAVDGIATFFRVKPGLDINSYVRQIKYKVVAIDKDNLPAVTTVTSAAIHTIIKMDYENYVELTWRPVAGAKEFFVYQIINDQEAYLGRTNKNTFTDMGLIPANYSKGTGRFIANFNSPGDYPGIVTFFDQRLIFAATINEPNTIWGSNMGIYHGFMTESTPTDTCAWKFSLASGSENNINWVISSNRLLIGTSGEEWRMSGNNGNTITPTSVEVRRETSWGSTDLKPLSVGDETLFLDRSKKSIRSFSYSYSRAEYLTTHINLFAEHLTRNNDVVDWAYSQGTNSFIYIVATDGSLLVATYDKGQQVCAWHKYITDGKFLGITVIPSEQLDLVFAIIERTIDSKKVRYIERLKNEYLINNYNDYCEIFHLDAMLTYRGLETSIIKGLEHLKERKVIAIADGSSQYELTVSADGSINLPKPAKLVHVGLPYESILETLPIEAETTIGTMQTRQKRITEIAIKLENSLGVMVGSSKNNLTPLSTYDSTSSANIPKKLFSGVKNIANISGYDIDGSIIIKQDNALPSTIIGIYPKIKNLQE